ncbi:MAG: ABC transporter ATP-binding protein [Clostridia bacterium]|nr:ABC transporter ATP-binding protein [Clostridia bacterium]
MENIIQVKNLVKSYKDINAVNDISFDVKEGSFFAFLGLNGAGKSTTINIICGDVIKNSGQVFIDGLSIDSDISKIKPVLGIVYQDSVLDKNLTVKDNLECRGLLYNLSSSEVKNRIEELNVLFNINELLNRQVGKLSGGQRRRVDIARALIHNPKILILDEPTTGLDPQTRKMVWEAIQKLREKQKITVFLTTHYMEEVIDADNVVILDNGKIVATGSPLELKNKWTGDYIRLYNSNEDEIKTLGKEYKKLKDCFLIEISNSKEATDLIINNPSIFVDYEIIKGKMDDVFLAVTGKSLNQGGYINE